MTIRTISRSFLLLGVAVALASCNDRKASNSDTAPTTGARADEGSLDSGPASLTSVIELEVTGGDHAGHYTAEVTQGGCSAGLTGPNSWGNQYVVDTQDPRTFSSLQMIVPDAGAAASGTDHFLMTVGFGPIMNPTNYRVDTRNSGGGSGSGTVTVEDHGATGIVRFDAKTADGVGLKGTIDCRSVVRG